LNATHPASLFTFVTGLSKSSLPATLSISAMVGSNVTLVW
jgi:hypothetical protein